MEANMKSLKELDLNLLNGKFVSAYAILLLYQEEKVDELSSMSERVGLVKLFLVLVIPWVEQTNMIWADGEDLLAVGDSNNANIISSPYILCMLAFFILLASFNFFNP